jgi:hypothetical protein
MTANRSKSYNRIRCNKGESVMVERTPMETGERRVDGSPHNRVKNSRRVCTFE